MVYGNMVDERVLRGAKGNKMVAPLHFAPIPAGCSFSFVSVRFVCTFRLSGAEMRGIASLSAKNSRKIGRTM